MLFFSSRYPGRYGMLGLGDIVLPGMLISFLLRYETSTKTSNIPSSGAVKGGLKQQRWTGYYSMSIVCFLIGEDNFLLSLLLLFWFFWFIFLKLNFSLCGNYADFYINVKVVGLYFISFWYAHICSFILKSDLFKWCWKLSYSYSIFGSLL